MIESAATARLEAPGTFARETRTFGGAGASANGSHASASAGEARFVGPEVLAELLGEAAADGLLTVQLETPGPGHRGRLGVLVEAAIEAALERRGACPPGVAAATDLASPWLTNCTGRAWSSCAA